MILSIPKRVNQALFVRHMLQTSEPRAEFDPTPFRAFAQENALRNLDESTPAWYTLTGWLCLFGSTVRTVAHGVRADIRILEDNVKGK